MDWVHRKSYRQLKNILVSCFSNYFIFCLFNRFLSRCAFYFFFTFSEMINEKLRLWFAFVMPLFKFDVSVAFSIYLSVYFGCCVITYYYRFSMQRDMSMWNQLMIEFLMRHNIFHLLQFHWHLNSLLVISYLVSRYCHFYRSVFVMFFFYFFMFVNYSMFSIRQFRFFHVVF